MLDTNSCIAVLTNRAKTLVERWNRTSPSQVRLCSVVTAELLFGAEKSSKRELAQQNWVITMGGMRRLERRVGREGRWAFLPLCICRALAASAIFLILHEAMVSHARSLSPRARPPSR